MIQYMALLHSNHLGNSVPSTSLVLFIHKYSSSPWSRTNEANPTKECVILLTKYKYRHINTRDMIQIWLYVETGNRYVGHTS